jgi:hypothetical protein
MVIVHALVTEPMPLAIQSRRHSIHVWFGGHFSPRRTVLALLLIILFVTGRRAAGLSHFFFMSLFQWYIYGTSSVVRTRSARSEVLYGFPFRC